MESISSAPTQAVPERTGIAYLLLIFLLAIIMGGVFPTIFTLFSQGAVWATWVFFWITMIITIFSDRIPVPRLLIPTIPFAAWMLGYICWGFMAATYPIWDECYRLAFRFGSIAVAMAIVTSHPRKFNIFANAAQWVLVVNLAITIILMVSPQYQSLPIFSRMDLDFESDRFAGLWGNANHAGLVALLILVMSHWATRWVAWLGRISGCLIVYLTASRTAVIISTALILLYTVFGATWKTRIKIFLAAALVVICAGFYLGSQKTGALESIQENTTVSRVMDLSESKTREKGGGSRVDVAKAWLALAAVEPWYGYGLYTMNGTELQVTGVREGFPGPGTHNLYIGILIDVGLTGLLTFLMVVGWQLVRIYKAPLEKSAHRMLFALCFITLVFALANHNMVSDFPGWIAFSLIFLLPSSSVMRIPSSVVPDHRS